jgi:hypothetical protein
MMRYGRQWSGFCNERMLSLPLWLAIAALLGSAYVVSAWAVDGLTGFPLDDAWIHQTYARNLGVHGEWAFLPGQVSAGSTAPLWSLLLALGYRLGVPYSVWTYGLGITALGVSAWLAAGWVREWVPQRRWMPWLAGLTCVAEWHLVWASVSGMETVLYICLALIVVQMANIKYQISSDKYQITKSQMTKDRSPTAICHLPFDTWYSIFAISGFTGGLLVLVRPEGLVVVGLAALLVGWSLRRTGWRLLAAWTAMGLGLALPLLPYLAFHLNATGQPFPNTLYAKQQEYRAMLDAVPMWQRWLSAVGVTLVGGQVLLVPGFVYAVLGALNLPHPLSPSPRSGEGRKGDASDACSEHEELGNNARRAVLLLGAWWLVHLILYALRLPVTYQHGRYQMPVIVAFVLVGVFGTAQLLNRVAHPLMRRVVSRAALGAGGLLWVAFLIVGGRAYAADVGFIQGEMVTTAHWLAAHTPDDSLIAVHDIGAVGYFAPRRLLDLAGLITPEVVPVITDDAGLMALMRSQQVDYVVFFPDWSAAYRRLALDPHLVPVYTTGYAWTRGAGRANMTVYRLLPVIE